MFLKPFFFCSVFQSCRHTLYLSNEKWTWIMYVWDFIFFLLCTGVCEIFVWTLLIICALQRLMRDQPFYLYSLKSDSSKSVGFTPILYSHFSPTCCKSSRTPAGFFFVLFRPRGTIPASGLPPLPPPKRHKIYSRL